MPIVIDEVLITVEVNNPGTSATAAGSTAAGSGVALAGADKQALVAECVERVLGILAAQQEP
jgi:hypothetical protein